MKINIIDLDLCNVNSIAKCVEFNGFKYSIAKKPSDIVDADKIIFPGIGSYPEIMKRIRTSKWIEILKQKIIVEKKNYLGICLGMQILSSEGSEFYSTSGLGYLEGSVVDLTNLGCDGVLPHTGWNSLNFIKKNLLFKDIKNGTNFYFNHSFVFNVAESETILSQTEYKVSFTSSINKDNIFGVQFHPEKSSEAGIKLIKNFLTL